MEIFCTYFVHLLLHVLHPLLEEHLGGHLRDELLLQPPDRVVLHQAGRKGDVINLDHKHFVWNETVLKPGSADNLVEVEKDFSPLVRIDALSLVQT